MTLASLAACLATLAAVALGGYTAVELSRFQRAETRRGALIYAAGQTLEAGTSLRAVDLPATLGRLRYTETAGAPRVPGQFHRGPAGWDIFARSLAGGRRPTPARVRLDARGGRVARVLLDGHPVQAVTLESEVLTSVADRASEDSWPVRLADVPPAVVRAVLAAEDHRFFEHRGLDARGLLRAAWTNARAGRITQGGSTLTQQLVKNRLLDPHRTLGRKLREAWLATVVEWRYTKEQILEAYLNEAYLGQRGPLAIRGVGAAARAYFHKDLHALTLGEAALLAGMLRAPNSNSPALDPGRARRRRDVVLARMLELGMISAGERDAARREPIRVPPGALPGQPAPYFADLVRQEIEHRMGGDLEGPGGIRIDTTLDLPLQRFAERAVSRGLERIEAEVPRLRRGESRERLQAVLVALDPVTGGIRALVGGRDYAQSQFDRAVQAWRQPGSAFKPIVYAAALRARRGGPAFTAASRIDDEPIAVPVGGRTWAPRNYEGRYEGRVSVRRALELSLNAATVRIAREVGLDAVVDTARDLGLTGPLTSVPALALGALEVTPLDLARAYAPFANGGQRLAEVTTLSQVGDAAGERLLDLPVARAPALSPAEAYLMTALLEGVIRSGTGTPARALGVDGSVAGKTGTTNEGRDSWFVGYTPSLVALVWVGFDSGEPHGLSGARAALPIWADFMRQALDAYPAPVFEIPPGITVAPIDATNGRLANRFCPLVAQEAFLSGTEPPPCEEHGGVGDRLLEWWRHLRDWMRW